MIKNKFIILSLLVMLLCCVSAASAADIDNTDDITDDITVDEVSEIVEEVETDDVQEDVVGEDLISSNEVTVTNSNYDDYFNSDGYMTTSDDLKFSGSFDAKTFGNFKINSSVSISASDATFTNVGFDLLADNISLNGGTFIATSTATNVAAITVGSSTTSVSGVTVNNADMHIETPSTSDYFAISVLNGNYAKLLNNVIYYEVPVATTNYNHVIRVVSSANVVAYNNDITAYLPLKAVDFSQTFPSIYTDQVAGVAVQSSENFNFTGNTLDVIGNARLNGYPTLDALIIVQSANSYIVGNTIDLRDNVSGLEETNYLYAVDVYECDNITIDSNVIDINSKGGNLTVNGTGAAYGIQLTGSHTGVVISNNNITTANNGPNLGIYSQNFYGTTELTITGNIIKVTGRAGDNSWALVSGMELQDTSATVTGNTIIVNNTAGYDSTYCAYGISYSQSTYGIHYFDIENNNVTVINGDYAVYLLSAARGEVSNNYLNTTTKTGDNATSTGSRVSVSGNY